MTVPMWAELVAVLKRVAVALERIDKRLAP